MGGAPGEYSTKEYLWPELGLGYFQHEYWQFDGYAIAILFDEHEQVVSIEVFDNLQSLERPWQDKFCDVFR